MAKGRKLQAYSGNLSIICQLLISTGMSVKGLNVLIFGCNSPSNWQKVVYSPKKLSVEQLLIIGGLLGGKYSFPLLCALAVGYNWGNVPKEWFDVALPPIPPELEEHEQVVISKKEYKRLNGRFVKDDLKP